MKLTVAKFVAQRNRVIQSMYKDEEKLPTLLERQKILADQIPYCEALLKSYEREGNLLAGRTEANYQWNLVLIDAIFDAGEKLRDFIYDLRDYLELIEWEIEEIQDAMFTRLHLCV